jgi:SAM-dependent methyltransferase
MDTASTKDLVGMQTLEYLSGTDALNKWVYQSIQPHLIGNILEIGSGLGNISKFLIQDGYSITLSDYNQDYCRILKEKYTGIQNVKGFYQVNLQNENFELDYRLLKESFDTIFLLNVIEHIENEKKAIDICRFLLKEGGNLIILAPSYRFLYCRMDKELGHFRRYTLKRLESISKAAGFHLVKKQYFNALGIAGWFVSGKLLTHSSLQKNELNLFNKLVPLAKLIDRIVSNKIGLSSIIIVKKA